MKESKEDKPSTKGVPARLIERIVTIPWYCTVLIAWLILIVVSSCTTPTASYTRSGDQWNVMVVPSQQTVFSQRARELFNKNCASCHSKDGRAQTPAARLGHVQDLSECRLGDEAIVEQILNGTHNKENTMKMPPFKDKLSRAEVQSLVPLVRSFRSAEQPPSSSTTEAGRPVNPRLVGLVNLGNFEYAVFEKVQGGGQYFMLRKHESHDGVTLERMNHKNRTVMVTLTGTRSDVELGLEGQPARPKRTGMSGFFKNLGDALTADPEGIVLKGANVDLVLFLYSQLTSLTLLQATSLPDESFDVEINTSGPNDAAQGLKRALRTKGITTTGDGPKFLLVVPQADVTAARQLAAQLRSSAHNNEPPGLFPGGAIINLPNSELNEVVNLYSTMTGRSLDQGQPLPSLSARVRFTTQTPLDPKECIYACEMLLGLRGLKIIPVGENSFCFVERSEQATP